MIMRIYLKRKLKKKKQHIISSYFQLNFLTQVSPKKFTQYFKTIARKPATTSSWAPPSRRTVLSLEWKRPRWCEKSAGTGAWEVSVRLEIISLQSQEESSIRQGVWKGLKHVHTATIAEKPLKLSLKSDVAKTSAYHPINVPTLLFPLRQRNGAFKAHLIASSCLAVKCHIWRSCVLLMWTETIIL